MFYIGNRASDDAVSATAGIDTSDRGLCNHLQGEYQLTVRFGLFGSNRYGIPELFGREASFIDDRIDRLQPVVGGGWGTSSVVKSLVQPTSNPKIASSDKYFMFFISN